MNRSPLLSSYAHQTSSISTISDTQPSYSQNLLCYSSTFILPYFISNSTPQWFLAIYPSNSNQVMLGQVFIYTRWGYNSASNMSNMTTSIFDAVPYTYAYNVPLKTTPLYDSLGRLFYCVNLSSFGPIVPISNGVTVTSTIFVYGQVKTTQPVSIKYGTYGTNAQGAMSIPNASTFTQCDADYYLWNMEIIPNNLTINQHLNSISFGSNSSGNNFPIVYNSEIPSL